MSDWDKGPHNPPHSKEYVEIRVGSIVRKTPLGKATKAQNYCPRCEVRAPYIDWSRRIWKGRGEEMGIVQPCSCAEKHIGMWLAPNWRYKFEVFTKSQYYPKWNNDHVFPIPTPDCNCDFCIFRHSELHGYTSSSIREPLHPFPLDDDSRWT